MSVDNPTQPYNALDPYATFISASCFDFLLIELVPMAQRLATELSDGNADEDEQKEVAYRRLESLGHRVGQSLVERLALSQCRVYRKRLRG